MMQVEQVQSRILRPPTPKVLRPSREDVLRFAPIGGASFGGGARGIKRAGAAAASFDAATVAWTGWYRASFTASPWTPTSSAGISGTNGNLVEGTNPPGTAAIASSGLTAADFDGADDLLTTANGEDTFYPQNAYTIVVLFNVDAADAPGADIYDNPTFWTENNASGGPIMSFTTSGVHGGHYDGAWKSVTIAANTGNWHLAFLRFNGSDIEMGVDGGATSSVSAGNSARGSATLHVGRNYNGTKWVNGKIGEIMITDSAQNNTVRTSLRTGYFAPRYGVSV